MELKAFWNGLSYGFVQTAYLVWPVLLGALAGALIVTGHYWLGGMYIVMALALQWLRMSIEQMRRKHLTAQHQVEIHGMNLAVRDQVIQMAKFMFGQLERETGLQVDIPSDKDAPERKWMN